MSNRWKEVGSKIFLLGSGAHLCMTGQSVQTTQRKAKLTIETVYLAVFVQ